MSPQASHLFAQGAAALEAENFEAAEALFGHIVAAEPNVHEAWNALSVVAVRAGNPEVAAMRARQALELNRRNHVYLNNLGVACGELLDYEQAESAFRRALKLRPVYPEALFNLAKLLRKQERLSESLQAYERAFAMDPEFPGVRLGFAALLRTMGRAERALGLLTSKTGEVTEMCADSYAQCLLETQGARPALEWLEGAVLRYPGSRSLRLFHAELLLSLGEWRPGWQGYLWRATVPRDEFPPRIERVKDVSGKRVLLIHEQGIGDVLFFLRFADELRAAGASLTLRAPARLFPLLRDLDFQDERAPYEPGLFHRVFWLGDLPAALESTATPPAVTLQCNETLREELARKLANLGPPPYMALTWRAGTEMIRRQEFGNRMRSLSKEIDPRLLGEAVRGWPGTLIALQRRGKPEDLAVVSRAAGAPVHDLSPVSEDLPRLTALLRALDEYVGVSNTNIHLLAGLGRTARVLVPQPYEWRWMQEGESPWFPGFALYRQPASRDWSEPLARLRTDLFARS